MVLGDKRVYDLTTEFRAAAGQLPTAILVKSESFTLFESVTALEIMDPKMDSGCVAAGETLEDKYDVCRQLLPEEVIGIMDQLLCCEMAWHEGYPLSQTVFASHYIDKILDCGAKTLADAQFDPSLKQNKSSDSVLKEALRFYSIGVVLCCHFVIEKIIASGHFYEEEDFSTYTFGREMFPILDPLQLMRALLKVQSELKTL